MSSYMIRGGQQGKARLQLLANALRPSTLTLLHSAGIKQGMVCLDVGCGGGDVTFDLARLVGPHGSVVGIDMDAVKLALAQQDADQEGHSNVAFHVRDATTLDAEGIYDLVYARFLLTHLRDPQMMVRRMVRAAKPGGAIVLEDINHAAIFCYPACAAVDRYITLYNQVAQLKGADPEIGPKLPDLLRQANAHAIQLHVVQPAFLEGGAKRIHQITLENIAESIIAGGLAAPAELAAVAAELEAFAQNPHTLVGFPRIFQVWGYRRSADNRPSL
jgi:ubiquinone/menaquinone biosynthesis C-methylase UbiE